MGRNTLQHQRSLVQTRISNLFAIALLVSVASVGQVKVAQAAPDARKDSVRVDGRVVFVDAQVQFDSLIRSPKAGLQWRALSQVLSRNDLRKEPVHWEVASFVGIGKGPLEGPRWDEWTGQYDWSHTLSLQQGWISLNSQAVKQRGWEATFGGQMQVLAQQLGGANVAQFPDSVIGFIPVALDEAWSAVTYKRYSNGIETDTIAMEVRRNTVIAASFELGFDFRHRLGWRLQMHAGGMVNSQASHRLEMEAPELDRAPWQKRSLPAWRLLPVASLKFGKVLGAANNWRFASHGVVQIMPQSIQNRWVGVGVNVLTVSRTNSGSYR